MGIWVLFPNLEPCGVVTNPEVIGGRQCRSLRDSLNQHTTLIRKNSSIAKNSLAPSILVQCWKINSFLFEITVCWSCTEKITIQIERAFSVILRASVATRRSFQLSPQQTSDLIHNWQLQMQDGVFQALPLLTVASIHRLYVEMNIY